MGQRISNRVLYNLAGGGEILITGMEIRNQQFTKTLRGYSEEEVKQFLQHVAQDYENLYSENSQLKETIQKCKFELDKYRKIEESMNSSLILAQQTAEGLKTNAQNEADQLLADAKRSIGNMMKDYQDIIKQINLYNLELKAQLNVQLELLDKNLQKNEIATEFINGPNVKEVMTNLTELRLVAEE